MPLKPRAKPTWEQPLRTVGRRWCDDKGQRWVLLVECGHDEPASGLGFATAVRCRECNPVRVSPIPIPPPVQW